MKLKIIAILFISISSLLLFQSLTSKTKVRQSKEDNIKSFSYSSLTIPKFFEKLIINHSADFLKIYNDEYKNLCSEFKLQEKDSNNIKNYLTIRILHGLFTSQNASNCSKGEILNIPYLWHWVDPNPRHQIYLTKTNQLLKNTKPTTDFSKYNSCADIDRTPYLFLSDLVEVSPKYYSASCDSFSTFGWCSEREMAFVCLTELLGYNGKVIAENNHSWSEFLIQMNTKENKIQHFKLHVDNTFNRFILKSCRKEEIPNWKKYVGNSPQAKWYNDKAHSSIEKQKVQNHIVPQNAMKRIEKNVVSYLTKKL